MNSRDLAPIQRRPVWPTHEVERVGLREAVAAVVRLGCNVHTPHVEPSALVALRSATSAAEQIEQDRLHFRFRGETEIGLSERRTNDTSVSTRADRPIACTYHTKTSVDLLVYFRWIRRTFAHLPPHVAGRFGVKVAVTQMDVPKLRVPRASQAARFVPAETTKSVVVEVEYGVHE